MKRSVSTGWARMAILPVLSALVLVATCAGPILPQRSKPGGSARWAEGLALQKVVLWSNKAQLFDVTGAGVGADGWLPDRGGSWVLSYWSDQKPTVFQVTVDSEGGVRTRELPAAKTVPRTLPSAWQDSPKVWAATRRHQVHEPVHTFDAQLGFDIEPERFKDQPVWRIRFFEQDNTYETHVVDAAAKWLATY